MKANARFIITAIILVVLCQQDFGYTQSFGLEIGTAAVENFDPGVLNWGFSMSMPVNAKFLCDLSYNHWQGEDGNLEDTIDSPDWEHFGNSGVNLSVLYTIYGRQKFSILLGGGLGRYQMVKFDDDENKNYTYRSTISAATLIKYRISKLFTIYGKGLVNTASFESVPNRGILNIGIELSPF